MAAVFSIFRFALAHKPSCHHVPLDHQSWRPPSPPFLIDSSSPVSPFEYEVALEWLSENKPLGQRSLATLFTCAGNMIEEHAWLCQGCDAHFSPQMEAISRIVYTVCGSARHLVKFESKFERAPVMLMHNVWTSSLQISLANKEVRKERFDNVCSSLMTRTNTDRKYQALTITAHPS